MKVYNKEHTQRKAATARKEAARYKDGKGKERKLARDKAKVSK